MFHAYKPFTNAPHLGNGTTAVVDQDDPQLVAAAVAPAGSTALTFAPEAAGQSVPIVEQAAAAGRVPLGTSTAAAGWTGLPPVVSPETASQLVGPGSAPWPGLDQTPFRRAVSKFTAFFRVPPVKNEWAVESPGTHGNMPGPTAATPQGVHLAGTSQRGNSWRLQPQPWDTDVYVGLPQG